MAAIRTYAETVTGRKQGARARLLVVSFSELSLDARVLRQVEFLASRYEVVVAAFGKAPNLPPGVVFLELPRAGPGRARARAETLGRVGLRLAGLHRAAYWLDTRVRRWRHELEAALPVDAVVVNDLFGLPLASQLAAGVPLIFDAHEHWTSESASWTKLQRLSMRGSHEWIVDHYVPQTAAMMTVSAGIARDFERRTGASPQVIVNAPFFRDLSPSQVEEPMRLLHVGIADERRRLEDTMEAVRSLDREFLLDLVLLRDNAYRHRLEALAASDPRIRVLPPLPAMQVVPFANRYDVGVFLLPDRYPNQVHVLPNKLFDYIQARLAVAVGPSREMAEIVWEWDCGVVSADFTPAAFAAALSELTVAKVERMKKNADRAARVLTADANRDKVISLVEQAMDSESPPR